MNALIEREEQFLPDSWLNAVSDFITIEDIRRIYASSRERRKYNTVYPPDELVFNAFRMTPPEKVRCVILGQDPYHGENEAHGLAFSVPDGIRIPPSLRNIFKEYHDDLGRDIPLSGNLSSWAANGVLLLNTVLTVDADTPASHSDLNWQRFTDAVIRAVDAGKNRVSFILWGSYAKSKASLISARHKVILSAHPSPLSAYRGFFGSKPFSQAEHPDWSWPEL